MIFKNFKKFIISIELGGLIYWHKPTKGYQVGIVSWGIECGSDKPGVYTKVESHINWINEQTQDALKCE